MLTVLILAAGKGTRMRSDNPKVLFEAAGSAMIDYVLTLARQLKADKIVTVVGSGADAVINHAKSIDVTFCLQTEQKGTADAVKSALEYIEDSGKVLILCGDMPLLTADILRDFIDKSDESINFISVKMKDPKGYGRVVRSFSHNVLKIVEEKDANANERNINEVNTGVYLCDASVLKARIANVGNCNAQNEYYLTDIVNDGAGAYLAEDERNFLGVNDRLQLANASKILWRRRADEFMRSGVSIIDPDSFYADEGIEIGVDSVIYPNVTLQKGTIIGKRCVIMPGVRITDSVIEDDTEIRDNSLIEGSKIGAGSAIGPMAHLRPHTVLAGDNKVGNFVELKKCTMGYGSKASHLTYLGDAELGRDVNIGCGTITCNYDGFNKYDTKIGDNVFIGSDVQLVAPVTIGDNALIGAGTTVTKDVPACALALSRTEQRNIENGGKTIMDRNRAKKH